VSAKHAALTLSCTWEGMVISRWRTGQFVQGRSCRLNEIVSFTLHYSINWIYTETDRGIVKSGICLVVYNLHLITMILFYHRNVGMGRQLMFYDAVLTSIFISFVYSTLNGYYVNFSEFSDQPFYAWGERFLYLSPYIFNWCYNAK
jgi:hypothetical protein